MAKQKQAAPAPSKSKAKKGPRKVKVEGFSMQDTMKAQRERQQQNKYAQAREAAAAARAAALNEAANKEAETHCTAIDAGQLVSVTLTTPLGRKVIQLLQDAYRGTKVRWMTEADVTRFSTPKVPKKEA